jgi:glyoxylase I family protein
MATRPVLDQAMPGDHGLGAAVLLLGLRPVDAERASDRFDPFRCGLDHLSFAVADRAELEAAVQAFQERGVEHSAITDLPPFGIAVLQFKDPDGLALELTAPL